MQLVRRDARVIQLLAPPFDQSALDPGYIKGYLPGVRENGGQYTHAALWAVMAIAQMGSGDEAVELFHMLNPINHSRTPAAVERYKVEPYVVAADVYTHPAHIGRGGWTWYTGSAALDVPPRSRVDPRPPAARRQLRARAVHPRLMGRLLRPLAPRGEPSTRSAWTTPGTRAAASRPL